MKRSILVFAILVVAASCGDRRMRDVDLEKAIPLAVQPVDTPRDAKPQSPTYTPPANTHALFNLPPGTVTTMASFAGAIDPVGTALADDLDGDGIRNGDETTTNRWVADYPVVETSVATPLTMQIEILKNTQGDSDQITSEIGSSDTEDNMNRGTEKVHENEVNERTVQFQDSYSRNDEASRSTSTSTSMSACGGASVPVSLGGSAGGVSCGGGQFSMTGPGVGGGGSVSRGQSSSDSWAVKTGYSETRTKWADKPFKNNLDRDAWSVKSTAAVQSSRKYRQEKNTKVTTSSVVKSDAGYVRAAFYVKNLSVNMPVHLSNILCTFMFERPDGVLVPVQSFRLKNDDFSPFEINVYGGSEFGPYVIELKNLNTAEVEKAMQLGYNPKIFIVDYEMTHVPDSNYRSRLLNFSGNNLKVVEENAKGRTAQIKIVGPNLRELFRVGAFTTNVSGDVCTAAIGSTISPGITLREALKRAACSGTAIEYDNFVLDLREAIPALPEGRLHVPLIKSIGGIQSKVPGSYVTSTGSDGIQRTAWVQKPFSQWSDAEKAESGLWVVFSRGKHFNYSAYIKDGTAPRSFNTPSSADPAVYMTQGIDSLVWVGDQYDIVYVSFRDFIAHAQSFGVNPLETGTAFPMNTKWDRGTVGNEPFNPDRQSKYLGVAGLGDKVELTFHLRNTTLLNPNFGANQGTGEAGAPLIFSNFTYDQHVAAQRFSFEESVEFEMSLGLGGRYSDWTTLRGLPDFGDDSLYKSCGKSVDYIAQTFTLCVELPKAHPLVSDELKLVNLFIRPTLNNAYRNSVWPAAFTDVKKYRAYFAQVEASGSSSIHVNSEVGTLVAGELLAIDGEAGAFTVLSVSQASGLTTIGISPALSVIHSVRDGVSVAGALSASQFGFYVESNTFSDWNATVGVVDVDALVPQRRPLRTGDQAYCSLPPASFEPLKCLGYMANYLIGNWIGHDNGRHPWLNEWSDAVHFPEFLNPDSWQWLNTRAALTFVESIRTAVSAPLSPGATQRSFYPVSGYSAWANKFVMAWGEGSASEPTRIAVRTFDPVAGADPIGGSVFYLDETPHTGTVAQGIVPDPSSSRALVYWTSYELFEEYDVRGRIVDLSTNAPLGSEFRISSDSFQFQRQHQPVAAVVGDRVFVAWLEYQDMSDTVVRVRGNLVDFNNLANPVSGAPFMVGDIANTAEWPARVLASGSKGAVVWRSQPAPSAPICSGDCANVYARLFQVNSGLMTFSGPSILVSTVPMQDIPVACNTGDRELILWTDAQKRVHGRALDMASGALSGEITIGAGAASPNIACGNGGALAAWIDISDPVYSSVKGRLLDLTTGNPVGPVFAVSSTTGATITRSLTWSQGSANNPYVALPSSGTQVLAAWGQEREGVRTFRGRYVDLNSGPLWRSEIVLSDQSWLPAVGDPLLAWTGDGNRGEPTFGAGRYFLSWSRNVVGSPNYDEARTRSTGTYPLDIGLQYGLNNFFTAPLIERNYDVRVQFKEFAQ